MAGMGDNFSFGYWLRRQRLARDQRQDDLAAQLGIATVTLRKLEADERRPSLQLLARVAEVFALSEAERELLRQVARADLSPAALPLPERAPQDLTGHLQQPLTDAATFLPSESVADLPADSPRLRARDARLRSLPTPPNPLIGREAELAAIATLLAGSPARLLTLHGPGGTGKTRLAIAAAEELANRFADGICFVDLTPVRDPALVLPAIGRALGLQESRGRPVTELIGEFLRTKALLLVLDNCEQVVGAAPDIAALLANAPQLQVLATSREALRVAAEHIYLVPPLVVPAMGDDELSAPAAQLFLARARAGRSDLRVEGGLGAAVAAICRRLDGLPLALELAAARMRHLNPQALLARLERPLDLLTTGPRDLPTRQQTLRTTIAWSYDLLSETEQILFRRLGVFIGGWDLAAAEAVSGLGAETLDLLGGLIDKSLVGQAVGVGDEPRYTMLETIREYALEQLAASGEAEATSERHARYFLTLAERARPEEFGPNATFWLDHLEIEYPNLLAALHMSLAHERYEQIARFCIALHWFWYYRGHFADIARWMSLIWEQRALVPPPIRATVLRSCGWLLPGAVRRAQVAAESLALYRELGDRHGLAWALSEFSQQQLEDGDIQAARSLIEEGMPLAREFDDPPLLICALYTFANVQICDGAMQVAQQALEEGLASARRIGVQNQVSDMLYVMGDLAVHIGAYNQAEGYYRESSMLRGRMGNRRGMAVQLRNVGEAASRQGAYDRGLQLLAESLRVFSDIAWPMGIGQAHDILAWTALRLGQPERAARFLGAEEMFRIVCDYQIWPTTRTEYERIVGDARAALDDSAFAATWAAGRALSVEAATAEALEWLAATHAQLRSGERA